MKPSRIISRVEANNTRLRKDKAKNFIETNLDFLKNKYKFYTRLLTCVHNPNNITDVEAWDKIYFDLININRIFSNRKYNIMFSVIVVEVHEGKETKKVKKTEDAEQKLKGYPHIHAELFFVSPDGKTTEMSEIINEIGKTTSFSSGDDIKIDGGEKKKGRQIDKSDENFLCYVLKNANHKAPFEMMGIVRKNLDRNKHEDVVRTIGMGNCYLLDNSNDKAVIDFFKGILERGVLINIPEEKGTIMEVRKGDTFVEHTDNAVKKITKKEESFKITLAAVIYYMNQENLKLYKKKVFRKVKGSRRTWEYWGEMVKIFGCLSVPSNDKILLDLLDYKAKVIEISDFEDQEILPQVDINWFFVEFKDFYLHLPSFAIVKGELPKEIVCGFMNEGLGLKDLDKISQPERWLTNVMCHPFAKDSRRLEDFFSAYYSISLPLIQKARVFCLYGPPNTMKSSTMEPMNRLFPRFMKTQVTEGRFSHSDLGEKRLLGLDDTRGKALSSANSLQLFEGGKDLMIEKKGENAYMSKFQGNIYVCTNEFPDEWMAYDEQMAEFILKEQYATRLEIFRFETKIKGEDIKPGFMKVLTSEEIGKVILFTGGFYAKKFLGRNSRNLLICDTYEECRCMLRDHEAIFEFQTK